MTDFSDLIFFAVFPQVLIPKTYNPRETIWFTNHMLQARQYPNRVYFFSPVYQFPGQQDFQISLTHFIGGNSGENIGVIEQSYKIADESISNTPYNIMLVNQQGEVILAGIDQVIEQGNKLYIYDVNTTGFNQTDWQAIQNYTTQRPDYSQGTDTFCLFNSYFNKSVIVNATLFYEQNFTLIIYSNTSFDEQLNRESLVISSYYKEKIVLNIYTQLFSNGVLLVFATLAIHFLFSPLRELMLAIYYSLKSVFHNLNVEIFKMLNQRRRSQKSTDTFSALRCCFFQFQDHLNRRQDKKSKVCVMIESLGYPITQRDENLSNKFEINQLSNNMKTSFSNDMLQSIVKQSLRQVTAFKESQTLL